MSLNCLKCDKCYNKSSKTPILLECNHKICSECFKELSTKSNAKCPFDSQKLTIKEENIQNLGKQVLTNSKQSVKNGCESKQNHDSYNITDDTSIKETSVTLNRKYEAEDLRVYRTVCFSYVIKRNLINNKAVVKNVKRKAKPKPIPQQVKQEEIIKVPEVKMTVIEEKELVNESNENYLFYLFVFHFVNNFIYTAEENNPISYHLKTIFRILLIATFLMLTVYYKSLLRVFIFLCIINLYYRALHQENMKEALSETIGIW